MANVLIQPQGDTRQVPDPTDPQGYTLEQLKSFIGGGYIELVTLDDNYLMVIDEEGRLKDMPLNLLASKLYGMDAIVGPAFVCRKEHIS